LRPRRFVRRPGIVNRPPVPPDGGPVRRTFFSLFISGLELRASAPGLPLIFDPDPPYAGFLCPGAPTGRGVVAVRFAAAEDVRPRGGRRTFDAGTWSHHLCGEDRVILFHPPGREADPLWSARLRPRAREVAVLCGRSQFRQRGGETVLDNPLCYPLDQLILVHALGLQGVLVHAAGVSWQGRGALLAGASGAGQTPIARLLAQAGFEVLSDDRMVAAAETGGPVACGTPWPGDGRQAVNGQVPLAALVFLAKGLENSLRPLGPGEGLKRLLPVTSIFWHDPPLMDDALSFCRELAEKVPAYEFTFTPGPGVSKALGALLFR
jgi:hypothetical protein